MRGGGEEGRTGGQEDEGRGEEGGREGTYPRQ